MKGILIETDEETSRSPMAIPKGFFSGLANATIFRNDDALFVVSAAIAAGRKRDNIDRRFAASPPCSWSVGFELRSLLEYGGVV